MPDLKLARLAEDLELVRRARDAGVRADRRRSRPRRAIRAAGRAPRAGSSARSTGCSAPERPSTLRPRYRSLRDAGDRRQREGDAARPACPPGSRPVSDRAREGLFSSLGPRVAGCARARPVRGDRARWGSRRCRGAPSRPTFVDARPEGRRRPSGENLRRGPGWRTGAVVQRSDVRPFRGRGPGGRTAFDLVFLDPPYDARAPPTWSRCLAALGADGSPPRAGRWW